MDDNHLGTPLPPDFSAEGNPTFQQLIDYAYEKWHEPELTKRRQESTAAAAATGQASTVAALIKVSTERGFEMAKPLLEAGAAFIIGLTDISEELLDPISRGAIESLLKPGEPPRGVQNAGGLLLDKLAGNATSVEPGTEGAARYLTLFINESMEATLRTIALEFLSEHVPERLAGLGGGVESVQKIQEVIEQALGGGRMVRRVLQPFISATAITPAQWHVNKRYRPELLSTGDAIRHFLRGRWTAEQLGEELARQGWSDERIDILVSNATKRLAIDELLFLHRRGVITDAAVIERVKDLGYDESTARSRIEIENTQAIERLKAALGPAAIDAYIDGRIDEAQLRSHISTAVPIQSEQVMTVSIARMRRECGVRPLTSTEVARLVKKGILAVVDYREALKRENRTPEAISALELELRADLQDQADVDAAKKAQADERAAAAKKAADDKAARDAEIAAKKAKAGFPAVSEYRKAYVRGRASIDAYAAALAREGIVQDAALLLEDAAADRADYLVAEEKRAAVDAQERGSTVTVSTLEHGVLNGIISLEEFDATLAKREIPDADRRLYTGLLQAKLDDQADARAKRADAEQRAADQGVSLSDFERAVRLGLQSRDALASYLDRLGMSDLAQTLILGLLDADMARDAEAQAKRDAADAAGTDKGIPLDRYRRAYIAGLRDRQAYADALSAAGVAPDDRDLELDLADAERAAADAARARRDQLDAEKPGPTVSLAQMEKAVMLGLLTGDDLRAWLADRGYSDDDAELIVALVVQSVPDTRAAQRAEPAIAARLAEKHVSLADLKSAVRRGLRTLDEFAAVLSAEGIGADDVALLRQLLAEEVALDVDGLEKKITATLGKADGAPALDELRAALVAGEASADEIQDVLRSFDVARDVALVWTRLQTQPAAGA